MSARSQSPPPNCERKISSTLAIFPPAPDHKSHHEYAIISMFKIRKASRTMKCHDISNAVKLSCSRTTANISNEIHRSLSTIHGITCDRELPWLKALCSHYFESSQNHETELTYTQTHTITCTPCTPLTVHSCFGMQWNIFYALLADNFIHLATMFSEADEV